jgi:hypothetical protein
MALLQKLSSTSEEYTENSGMCEPLKSVTILNNTPNEMSVEVEESERE